MDSLPEQFLEVHVFWASHHRWLAGQTHSHPSYHPGLWLMLQGDVMVQGRDIYCELAPGDALFWNDGERIISTQGGAEWLSVGLQVTLLGRTDMMRLLDSPCHWTPDVTTRDMMGSWMRQLVQERHSFAPGIISIVNAANIEEYSRQQVARRNQRGTVELLIENSLGRALAALCWRMLRDDDLAHAADTHTPPWLSMALKQLRHNPAMDVEELAEAAGFSAAQFRRAFRRCTGLSPRDYLKVHRLKTARHLLASTDLPVRVVAARCGFASTSHFIQFFKRAAGPSPAQYRQNTFNAHL
jgi:AraC-like DNA-binding protein